jgi:hypothetical protein
VGVVQEYSDTLLIFLLKGARPQKYRDNVRQEVTGSNGTPLVPTQVIIQLVPTPSVPAAQSAPMVELVATPVVDPEPVKLDDTPKQKPTRARRD